MPSSSDPKTVVQPGPGRLPSVTVPTGALIAPATSNTFALESHINDPVDAHESTAIGQDGHTGNYYSALADDNLQEALNVLFPSANTRAVFVVDSDGANDAKNFSSLQTALTTLASNTDTNAIIYLKAGTYTVTSDITNITIIGEDKGTTRIEGVNLIIGAKANLFNLQLGGTTTFTLNGDCRILSCDLGSGDSNAEIVSDGDNCYLENIAPDGLLSSFLRIINTFAANVSGQTYKRMTDVSFYINNATHTWVEGISTSQAPSNFTSVLLISGGQDHTIKNVSVSGDLFAGVYGTSPIRILNSTSVSLDNITVDSLVVASVDGVINIDDASFNVSVNNYTLSNTTADITPFRVDSQAKGVSASNFKFISVEDTGGTNRVLDLQGDGTTVSNVLFDTYVNGFQFIRMNGDSVLVENVEFISCSGNSSRAIYFSGDHSTVRNVRYVGTGLATEFSGAEASLVYDSGDHNRVENIFSDNLDLANTTASGLFTFWGSNGHLEDIRVSNVVNGGATTAIFDVNNATGYRLEHITLDTLTIASNVFACDVTSNNFSVSHVYSSSCSFSSFLFIDNAAQTDPIVFRDVYVTQGASTAAGISLEDSDSIVLENFYFEVSSAVGFPVFSALNCDKVSVKNGLFKTDFASNGHGYLVSALNSGVSFETSRFLGGPTNDGSHTHQLFHGYGRNVGDGAPSPLVVRDCEMVFGDSNCSLDIGGEGNGTPIFFFGGAGDAVVASHGPYKVDGLRIYPISTLDRLHTDSLIAFSGNESWGCSVNDLYIDLLEESPLRDGASRGVVGDAAHVELIGNGSRIVSDFVSSGSGPITKISGLVMRNIRESFNTRHVVKAEGWDIEGFDLNGPSSGSHGSAQGSTIMDLTGCTLDKATFFMDNPIYSRASTSILNFNGTRASNLDVYASLDDPFSFSSDPLQVILVTNGSVLTNSRIACVTTRATDSVIRMNTDCVISNCQLLLDTGTPTNWIEMSGGSVLADNVIRLSGSTTTIGLTGSSCNITNNTFEVSGAFTSAVPFIDATTSFHNIIGNQFLALNSTDHIGIQVSGDLVNVCDNTFAGDWGQADPSTEAMVLVTGGTSNVIRGNRHVDVNPGSAADRCFIRVNGGDYAIIESNSAFIDGGVAGNDVSIVITGTAERCKVIANTLKATSSSTMTITVNANNHIAYWNLVDGFTSSITVSAPSIDTENVVV